MDAQFISNLLAGYDIPIRCVRECTTLEDGIIEITELVRVELNSFLPIMRVMLEVNDVPRYYPERKFIDDIINDLNVARGFIPCLTITQGYYNGDDTRKG